MNVLMTTIMEAGARNSKKDLASLMKMKALLEEIIGAQEAEVTESAAYLNESETLVMGEPVNEVPVEKMRKLENGVPYPVTAYLLVEDPKKTYTWTMRVRDRKGSVDFVALLSATVDFLRGWYSSNGIVTEEIIEAVRSALIKVWEEAIPGFSKELLESAKEEPAGEELKEADQLGTEVVDEDLESSTLLESKADAKKNEAIIVVAKEGFGNKKDKHYYPAETLKEAADTGVFNGVKMYVDHLTAAQEKQLDGLPRSLKDWVATIKESWWDDKTKEVKAKVKVVKPYFMEFLQEAKDDIGVSIRGRGRVSPNKKVSGVIANVVESIMVPKSVDFVTEAGAGGRVCEILEAQINIKEELKMFETLSNEEIVTALRESKADVVTELQEAAIKPVQEKLTKMARSAIDSSVQAKILESDLPAASKERLTKELRESISVDAFIAAEDQAAFIKEAVDGRIGSEKEYLGKLQESKIITGMGNADQQSTVKTSEKSMAAAFGRATDQQ